MSRTRGHIPIRTCITCGAKGNKKDLIRLVLDFDGVVIIDDFGQGRGAYVCRNEDCLAVLKTGKGLDRAFKRKVALQAVKRGDKTGSADRSQMPKL